MSDPRTNSGDHGQFPDAQSASSRGRCYLWLSYTNQSTREVSWELHKQVKFHSVNLTAICDHKICFLDCYAGRPDSVCICRVLKNSDFYQTLGNKFQRDSIISWEIQHIYLGDLDHDNLSPQQRRFHFIHSLNRMVVMQGLFHCLRDVFTGWNTWTCCASRICH